MTLDFSDQLSIKLGGQVKEQGRVTYVFLGLWHQICPQAKAKNKSSLPTEMFGDQVQKGKM
jgi:hypothetical protein